MKSVRIGMLGSLRVGDDGRLLRSPRLRRLFAMLLIHHDTVISADRFAQALWGDAQPSDATSALQTLVWRLRDALRSTGCEPAVQVLTRAPGYLLQVDLEQVDALRFERLLNVARIRLPDQPDEAAALLEDALSLWRGPAYAEFADEEFARAEAARLEELRLAAVSDWVDAALALGRSADAIGRLEFLIAAHPLRERPHAQLMLALHRIGRSTEALEAFRAYRELLVEELGLDPSQELRDLEAAIIRRDPSLDSAQGPHPAAQAGNLRQELTELIGRADDVSQALAALGGARVVTLTGVGGVGKTRLALRVAADAQASYRDGVWVCELAAVRDGRAVPDAVATILGVQQRQGAIVTDRLNEYLRSKQLLLVLDNCEHVLDPAARLTDALVGGSPGVTVLATSREPLGVDGEQTLPVQPLPVPPSADGDPHTVVAVPSVTLFVQRVASALPTFAVSEANVGAVSEICRRLDGLPLALELAATRVRSMSVHEIAHRLDSRLHFLRSARRIREERHRTLRSVVDWSYELLTPAERALFDRVRVFAGAFTLDAAAQVAGGERDPLEVAEILAGLVDKSMLVAHTEPPPTRFTLLETLRAYGLEHLHERGEAAAAARAHACYHVELAEAAATGLRGSDEASWAQALAGTLDDLRSAHQWALTHEPGLAVRLSAGLILYGEIGAPSEVFSWAECAVAASQDLTDGLLPIAVAAVAGVRFEGDLVRATAFGQRALDALPDHRDPRRRYPLFALADVTLFEGRLEESAELYTAAAELAEEAGDAYFTAYATASGALPWAYQGDTRRAVKLADRAKQIARATGNPTVTAWADYALAEALLDDDPDRALAALEQAIAAARAARSRFVLGVALFSAASLHARHGDPQQALRLFGEVIEYWSQAGNWTQQWITLRNVIHLFTRLDAHEPAAVLYGALEASRTAVEAFGADADRLVADADTLRSQLGADRFATATARGAGMADYQAVILARSMIEQLTRSGPPLGGCCG
ncbi:MAG: BTAD domain-containing putative transcriptional regulator [Pseudonocardiaceae bacterium]